MARKASGPVVFDRLEWLLVRIVAGTAPESSAAIASAGAESKLLDVAYDFESPGRRARRHGIVVDGEGIFQALPRNKVAELFSWIQDTSGAKQVTLFADAVASRRSRFTGLTMVPARGSARCLSTGPWQRSQVMASAAKTGDRY